MHARVFYRSVRGKAPREIRDGGDGGERNDEVRCVVRGGRRIYDDSTNYGAKSSRIAFSSAFLSFPSFTHCTFCFAILNIKLTQSHLGREHLNKRKLRRERSSSWPTECCISSVPRLNWYNFHCPTALMTTLARNYKWNFNKTSLRPS